MTAPALVYHARSPLGVLEGLGSIQPEALDQVGVPSSELLDTTQWAAVGLTAAAGALSGAVLAWAVKGRPLSGALVGAGGAAVALAAFPPVWLTVERRACAAVPTATAAPSPTSVASSAARTAAAAKSVAPGGYHQAEVVSGPAEDRAASTFFGLGQTEVAVVQGYTRPSHGARVVIGLVGVAVVGVGLLAAGAR